MAGIFTTVAVPLYFVILSSLLSVYVYSKSSGEASGTSTGFDEDELAGLDEDELAGLVEELDDELELELLLDCSEDELA